MTGAEHYKEAERLLAGCVELYVDLAEEQDERVAQSNATALQVMATMAHTHATLAAAAAYAIPNAGQMPVPDCEAWEAAAGEEAATQRRLAVSDAG